MAHSRFEPGTGLMSGPPDDTDDMDSPDGWKAVAKRLKQENRQLEKRLNRVEKALSGGQSTAETLYHQYLTGKIGRRTFLAATGGAGVAGYLAPRVRGATSGTGNVGASNSEVATVFTNEIQDPGSDALDVTSDLDFQGNQSLNRVKSVDTEQATIDGNQADIVWELIGSDTSKATSMSVSGIGTHKELLVKVNARLGSATSASMTLNGDSNNGNYVYWTNSGTENTGQNKIELVSGNEFLTLSMTARIRRVGSQGTSIEFSFGVTDGKANRFSVAAGRSVAEDVTSVEVTSADFAAGAALEVYKR